MSPKFKYLKYFPKPFLEDLVYGRILPVIGAGFSRNAIFPPGKSMPGWDELGKSFADSISNYHYTGAIDAISAYQHQFARVRMIEKLTELLLTRDIRPGSTHEAFCRLPFQLVATTNFDFLLEQGYSKLQRYCRPIIEEEQLSIANGSAKEVSLFKIHGDLHHPKRIVATEEDYDGFLNRYPMLATYLANLFISKTVFFIGYSLDDPDMRQVFQLVKDRLGSLKRKAYTLRINSSHQDNARFDRRDVQVIDIQLLPGKSYAKTLEEIFEELREYWLTEYPDIATITEEDPLIELTKRKDFSDSSRLVYFAVPKDLISIYKKYIFPIVESNGFVPISADEMLGPGTHNTVAKISALIERSSIVIVHTDNINSSFELRAAVDIISEKREMSIIVITNQPYFDISNYPKIEFLFSDFDIFSDTDGFVDQFRNRFVTLSEKYTEYFQTEPQRLLDKSEYKAAVVSAITQVETRLRNILDRKLMVPIRVLPLNQLMKLATDNDLINQQDYNNLRDWNSVRNGIIHQNMKINGSDAKKIVIGVDEVLSRI